MNDRKFVVSIILTKTIMTVLFLFVGISVAVFLSVTRAALTAQSILPMPDPPCNEIIPHQLLIHPYPAPREPARNIDKAGLRDLQELKLSIAESERLRDAGRYKEAKEFAFKILDKAPNNTVTLFIVGNTYQNEGDFSKALEYYLKVEEINTVMFDLHFNIGISYYQLDKQDSAKAVKEYELEMRYNPDNWKPYINRGMIYARAGDYEKAFKDCATAVEIGKNNITALLIAARFSEEIKGTVLFIKVS